ncbi:AIPR family protein [Novipirellula sp.]|uniref:AIPR family protein n=1 Tax=Novipirellula sp. TaxID=2795430 RepID=UPI0035657A47
MNVPALLTAEEMSEIPEILSLFKEQLDNQVNAIVTQQEFDNDGYGFAYWYFRHIGGMTDIESKEQICDGGGDLGIDAIEIDSEEVLFYQFKNPRSINKSVATGEVDKMISGLQLILARDHSAIANPELLARLQEIYGFTPAGYRIVICASSMAELPPDSVTKLQSFCTEKSGPAKDLFRWQFSNLTDIHSKFYNVNLPTLDATLDIPLERLPYMTRIGDHETYLFDLSGQFLADLYEKHGEAILQQNVRMFEGDRGTNMAIASTAASPEQSKDFFHYNNGVSIICDSAIHKPFNNALSLERPQIVNGGQTIRILHRCSVDGTLQRNVHAAIRVITTGKDKEFASNVAVNLNNQTRVDNTFLRSNDPRIVQLFHSLSTLGYFLERRAGEIDAMLQSEIRELEQKFGSPLSNKVIPFKDGMQAYVATFFEDPQLAKKDPSKIFTDDGGSFSKVLQSDLTAEKFRDAYELSKLVANQVDRFKKIKRKRYASEDDRRQAYATGIGTFLEPVFSELDSAIPQMTIFGMAVLYHRAMLSDSKEPLRMLIAEVSNNPSLIWKAFIELIEAKRSLGIEKSWPTILKSGSFFRDALASIKNTWAVTGAD